MLLSLTGLELQATVTIEFNFGNIEVSADAVGILVADVNGDGFHSLRESDVAGTALVAGERIGGSDDVIVALVQSDAGPHWNGAAGFAETIHSLDYDLLQVSAGQSLTFYWFPDILTPGAELSVGVVFREYRSDDDGQGDGLIGFALPPNRGKFVIERLTTNLDGGLPSGALDEEGEIRGGRVGLGGGNPNNFIDWAASFGIGEVDAHLNSDTDFDRISLLEEFAFNLDPTRNDSKTGILGPGSGIKGLPHISLVDAEGGAKKLRVEYVRRINSGSVDYIVEFASNLRPDTAPEDGWNEATGQENVSPIDQTWERVVIEDTANSSEASRRFGRVLVNLIP